MDRRIATLALLLALVVPACGGGGDNRPQAVLSSPPYDGCVRTGQVITVIASDGQPLKGALLGSGTSGVVLGHMGGRNLCSWVPFAETLAGRGYQALALDFRGYFGSTLAAGKTKQTASDLDIAAGVAELRKRGATKVVIIGASLGAIGGVVAATHIEPPVQGVVQISGPAECCGLNAAAATPKLRVPILYVVADGDGEVFEPIKEMHAQTKVKDKKLVVYEGTDHGTDIFDGPDGGNLEAELLAFVTKYAPLA